MPFLIFCHNTLSSHPPMIFTPIPPFLSSYSTLTLILPYCFLPYPPILPPLRFSHTVFLQFSHNTFSPFSLKLLSPPFCHKCPHLHPSIFPFLSSFLTNLSPFLPYCSHPPSPTFFSLQTSLLSFHYRV